LLKLIFHNKLLNFIYWIRGDFIAQRLKLSDGVGTARRLRKQPT
jgi:hypothetical protein